MKKPILILSLFLVALLSTMHAAAQKKAKIQRLKKIAVAPVLAELKNQYDDAAKKLRNDKINISITEASVAFAVTQSITGEVGLEIVIVKVGGKRARTKNTTVTYNLSKPETKEGVAPAESLKGLSDLIVRAGKEFESLYEKKGTLLGDLAPDSFEIEISFGVTFEATTGVTFLVFSGEGVYEKTQEHTITLKFKHIK